MKHLLSRPSSMTCLNSKLLRHTLALLAFLGALNAMLPAAITHLSQQTFIDAIASGFGQSFVVWFSLSVSIHLWCKANTTHSESSSERLIYSLALVMSLGLLIPIATVNWLICGGCALLWLSQSRPDPFARAAALLLVATALRDPITKLFLTLFADQILSLDTWLTYLSLAYFENDNFSVQDNLISQTDGYDLLILTGCSAFVNLSLALLLWLALSLLHKPYINRLDLLFAFLVALSVIGLNTTRLALMAVDQYWYQLLHQGDGATLIELVILLIASTPFLGRIYYEKQRNSAANFVTCDGHSTTSENN